MLNRVLSFSVFGKDFVSKGLEELFFTAREYRIEKLYIRNTEKFFDSGNERQLIFSDVAAADATDA